MSLEKRNVALEKINLVAFHLISRWPIFRSIECIQQENGKTVSLPATHMLKTGCYEANNEKGLNENISKFWDLDVVGIKGNETSIYEKFEDDIKFENNCYSFKLPVK